MSEQSGYGLPQGFPQQPIQGYSASSSQQPEAPSPQAYPPYNYQPMAYYYYISSKLNGLVLDVEGCGDEPMTSVTLWQKKEVLEATNQLWYNDYTTGTIKSKLNNLCLEFKDGKMVVNIYQPGNPNQLWEGVAQVIKNRMNQNLVLEVQDGSSVIAANYTGSIQQQFEPIFPPPPPDQNYPQQLPPGQSLPQVIPSQPIQPSAPYLDPTSTQPNFSKKFFLLVSEMHGKVMDIEGCNAKEGATVIVFSKQNGARNQMWYLDEEGLIRSALNDFVPCASGKATPLKMVPFTGGASQRFRLDGKKIINGVGECADIRGAWKNDCAPVITYKYSGGSNQHWKVEYV